MKCPYSEDKYSFQQIFFSYTEAGEVKTQTTKEFDQYINRDCIKEGCAAWYEGRCHYKG